MVLEYINERNKELLKAEKTVLRSLGANAPFTSRKGIIRMVCEQPATRFYVSKEEAQRIISLMRQGIPLRRKGKKCQLYQELFAVYNKLKEENPDLGQVDLVEMAINTPASGFFLDESRIYYILNRIK